MRGGLASGAKWLDVLIEGFRPGGAERLGVGPAAFLAANPQIFYARFTSFGQTSDFVATAGHDVNYLAESGALHAFDTRTGIHDRR